VDIDPHTFNIDPEQIAAAITPRTRAIMPVHLFGRAAELDVIMQSATAHGLAVIEDAAQAIGTTYQGKCVGTRGAFGCFSFFPSKNLGGAGDGGMITTEDAALAEKLRLLRVHGSKKKYHHDILGTNSRLDALQAAILRVKLRHLEGWTEARVTRAERYRDLFKESGLSDTVRVPAAPSENSRHVYNQFSIRCRERDALREHLRVAGIPTEIYYPLPLHLQTAFRYLGHADGDFPHAESVSGDILALPVYPELSDARQGGVVEAIARFYADKN
jgi:dTDP-4-amino-4,6-dideoxygalactose transaminase